MKRRAFIQTTVAGVIVGSSGCLGDSYDEELWSSTIRPWIEDAIPFVENSHFTLSSWVLEEEDFDRERFEEMENDASQLQARRDAMPRPISEAGDPPLETWTIMMSRADEEWTIDGEDLITILNDNQHLAVMVDEILWATEDILEEDGQHDELIDDSLFMSGLDNIIEDAPEAVEFARDRVFNA